MKSTKDILLITANVGTLFEKVFCVTVSIECLNNLNNL